jgi:hypothetical protein
MQGEFKMSDVNWFMRALEVNESMTEGSFYMLNEPDEFEIDKEKWKDYLVTFKVHPAKSEDEDATVDYNVPSRNINLSMALAGHKMELDFILSKHIKPTLDVFGPQKDEKKPEEKSAE